MIYGTQFINERGDTAHTYGSWGMLQVQPEVVSPPKVQTNFIEVTGRDGSLDFTTALDGNVHYNSREFGVTLRCVAHRRELQTIYSRILNFLHGRKLKAICDDDTNYYWEGRFEAKAPKWNSAGYWEIDIKGTVDPYKYNVATTFGDWLWDPFVFETDIAWDYADIDIDEVGEVIVATSNMPTTPIFRVSAPMLMSVGEAEYNLPKGDSTIPGMVLTDTDTTFTFYGTGTVTIGFRGGSL